MSTPPTSDTSSPSVEIVSDDAGNLDGSWLNANYPFPGPILSIAFDRARTLTQALSYAPVSNVPLQYPNQQGVMVPVGTDMAGNLLPRFPYDDTGCCQGLLIDSTVESVSSTPSQANADNWLGAASGNGTAIVEGFLPPVVPVGSGVYELWRFQLDAQHYLVLGYTLALRNSCQLGLYLTNGSAIIGQMLVMSSVILPAGGFYKVAIAYSRTAGVLTLSGFAVNGLTALAMGQVGAALPTGVMGVLNFSTCALPLIISKLTGYVQALATNQLKYLTAV